jgi:hypothetical protein
MHEAIILVHHMQSVELSHSTPTDRYIDGTLKGNTASGNGKSKAASDL